MTTATAFLAWLVASAGVTAAGLGLAGLVVNGERTAALSWLAVLVGAWSVIYALAVLDDINPRSQP